jgi:hypothetical protein
MVREIEKLQAQVDWLEEKLDELTPCPMIAKLDAWSKARRKPGVYWVYGYENFQRVGEWDGHVWRLTGLDRTFDDKHLERIDERRILPPE